MMQSHNHTNADKFIMQIMHDEVSHEGVGLKYFLHENISNANFLC